MAQWWGLGYSSVVEAGVQLSGGKLGYSSVVEAGVRLSVRAQP